MAKSNTPYSKGKRWGFAVAKSSLKIGKAGVHKVDKAMQTCSKNARTGTRKLDQNERSAYRGMADGMYEAIKSEERRAKRKPRKTANLKRASQHKMIKRRLGQANKKKEPKHDYSKFFDFDSRGRIKGSYTPDGFFEPD